MDNGHHDALHGLYGQVSGNLILHRDNIDGIGPEATPGIPIYCNV